MYMNTLGTDPIILATTGAPSGPGTSTSVLYKFGMSPFLWALAATAGVGGYLYWKRKK